MSKTIVTRNRIHITLDHFKQLWAWLHAMKNRLLIVSVVLIPGIFIWTLSGVEMESTFSQPRSYFDENRDFTQIPFDELDAFTACKGKSRDKFQSRLLRLTIDGHSTHFDGGKGLFKMFLFADIGDLRDFEEMRVHCFVDPNEYTIDHYRAFSTKQKSLLDHALGIFGF